MVHVSQPSKGADAPCCEPQALSAQGEEVNSTMDLIHLRSEWAPNVTRELLAGTVVALALIPEAIAFSIVAGVDPEVGPYASFCIAVITAFAGGHPAMISAATGAMALLIVDLVRAAHSWDTTSINALDRVVMKFRHRGISVGVVGMNEAAATMVERLGTHDKPGGALSPTGH